MVTRKFLNLANLYQTQTFGIHESAEIIVINKHKKLISVAFQVVALSLTGFNYGHQFLIVCFVPSLYGNHFSQEKRYGISRTGLRSLLAKNVSYGIAGSMCFNPNITFQI